MGQPLTKGRSNREDLISLGVAASAAHSEGFVEIYTEHRVGSLKLADTVQISVVLVTVKRHAPIVRH